MVEITTHEFEGSSSITFDCETPADDAILAAGHEPNGYFWDGLVQRVVATDAPAIADALAYDSEGSMFCAVSDDAAALDVLAALLATVVNDPERVAAIIADATAAGFEFDD